jgi:DnaJ-class molecular chaperone
MASKYHPDKDGGSDEKFKQIQEAYDRLSHPDKYQQEHTNVNWNDARVVNWETFGENIFRQQQRPVIVQITVGLESTLHDQVRNIDLKAHNIAPTQITIPAGVGHGESIRYNVNPLNPNNYSTSQIIVQFNIEQHPGFVIAQGHLVKQVEVDAFDCMLGKDLLVNTLDNKTLRIKLPAGSQHGAKLKIPGNGLMRRMNNKRGDLYIVVNIIIPQLTTKQKEIITNLREDIK